jgi:hypothetical protein
MPRCLAALCAPLLLATTFGQSSASIPTFHVEGIIEPIWDETHPHVEVSFVGEHVNRTVVVDDKGYYQINLPVGAYTMTAVFPLLGAQRHSVLTKHVRFFQVTSPGSIKLNGVLYGIYSCDGVFNTDTEEGQEVYKDSCGGEDAFRPPSKDRAPLRLLVNYVTRTRSNGFVYASDAAIHRPVLVTYNLFALQADTVVYDPTTSILSASGRVLIDDQSGQSQTQSARFKIENGDVRRLPKLP